MDIISDKFFIVNSLGESVMITAEEICPRILARYSNPAKLVARINHLNHQARKFAISDPVYADLCRTEKRITAECGVIAEMLGFADISIKARQVPRWGGCHIPIRKLSCSMSDQLETTLQRLKGRLAR